MIKDSNRAYDSKIRENKIAGSSAFNSRNPNSFNDDQELDESFEGDN